MVESSVGDDDIMSYYGNENRPIAHFPFNFKLLGVRPEMNASEILNLVNFWYSRLPENEWATFLVSCMPYIQVLTSALCRFDIT